ncbi:hypothetical protein JMM61_20935 [Rhodovulum sulfidophilum]|uniref:hypothetical protein n=1 Tax=Rhodovulum sulfidophilum TaxID=35806 RepID=UPI0019271E58|nr:hypothetical protein [Rhodovulum sulfidophilum]MBL3587776.1 hypothetical protein [Rhodovulum sulfidophilum]
MTQATYLLDTGHTKAQAFAMLQGVLSAIQSGNAGATPPAEAAAGMVWVDTDARTLKMRNIANNGWITLGSFASGSFVPAGVNRLTEAQATDPTGTEFGATSGAQIAAAVDARMGAVGTPVNEAAWHPYDMVRVGDGADGLFWDRSVDGDGQYIMTPDFEDGYEYMVRVEGVSFGGSGTYGLVIKGWIDQTNSVTEQMPISAATSSRGAIFGSVRIVSPRVPGPFMNIVVEQAVSPLLNSNVSPDCPCGYGASMTLGAVDRTLFKAELSWTGGRRWFNAGKMYLLRRREYVSG